MDWIVSVASVLEILLLLYVATMDVATRLIRNDVCLHADGFQVIVKNIPRDLMHPRPERRPLPEGMPVAQQPQKHLLGEIACCFPGVLPVEKEV